MAAKAKHDKPRSALHPVAVRLREARLAAGYRTIAELAAASGIPWSTIKAAETASAESPPTLPTISRICDATGCEVRVVITTKLRGRRT